jgi:hypothetical protein
MLDPVAEVPISPTVDTRPELKQPEQHPVRFPEGGIISIPIQESNDVPPRNYISPPHQRSSFDPPWREQGQLTPYKYASLSFEGEKPEPGQIIRFEAPVGKKDSFYIVKQPLRKAPFSENPAENKRIFAEQRSSVYAEQLKPAAVEQVKKTSQVIDCQLKEVAGPSGTTLVLIPEKTPLPTAA